MDRVVGGLHAVDYSLASVHGEVGVELHHGRVRLHGISAIDLDLIVVLPQHGKI
jgi:hypothetical protein